MAEIAIAGATVALEMAVNWIGNQAIEAGSRLFKLKQDVEWIGNELELIQAYLETFDKVVHEETSNTIEAALAKNIRLLAYDIEDVFEKYMVKIASKEQKGRLGWIKNATLMLGNPRIALKLSKDIEDIKERINDVSRKRTTYGNTPARKEYMYSLMDERRSFPHTEDQNIIGLDYKAEKLRYKLINSDLSHSVVSITGMAGLGKTTLARKVYNSVKGNFECSAWICVSQQPNILELLKDVSSQVGMVKEQWEINTESNLYEFLQHQRYVIVIDDLWNNRAWDGLKTGIPTNTKNGSRVLLTSRHKDVGEYVGGKDSVYELEPLNEAESRNLFFEIIKENVNGESEHLSPALMEIAETILDKCNGVPLAIVLTSGMLLLRERVDYEWMGVLDSMGRKEDKCSQIFELSYKDLPSKLKPCFLYLGLFPEDYKIRASDLINLWIAERFIQGNETREVEDVGEEYLKQLVVRNLVQVSERKFNGRIKTCHVHDILHSLCVRVAKEINFFTNKEDLNTYSMAVTKVRRLANHDPSFGEDVLLGYNAPKLRSLFVFRSFKNHVLVKEFKEFTRDLEYLRVLRIGEAWIMSVSRTIGKLIHLTYIQIKTIGKAKIPSAIRNLRSLMTLDARGSLFLIIPSCIWEMECLRHLLLGRDSRIEYPSRKSAFKTEVDGNKFDVCAVSLRSLHTLHLPYEQPDFSPNNYQLPNLRKLGVSWDKGNSDNAKKLIKGAPKIEILSLKESEFDSSRKAFDIGYLNLYRYENLWKLSIKTRIQELTQYNLFPINITKLIFEDTGLKEDPMEVLKKLPRLKFLRFGDGSYMGLKMCVSSGAEHEDSKCVNFPHLQVLQIELGSYFKEVDKDGCDLLELVIEEPAMPQLNNMSIGCRRKVTVHASQRIKNKVKRVVDYTQWCSTVDISHLLV